jgi:hypothetical protein
MSTVGEIIKLKYNEFLGRAKLITGDKIPFPTLNEIPLSDLLMLLEMCFPDNNTEVNLMAVLILKGFVLSKEQTEKMVVLIDEVLELIKTLKNKMNM